ncbi:restriction endonuclease [Dyella japonica]|uniref:Restriction endonuclease type IV Mrr domain-containing protein n=1 Tax=Dyella japonica A8 TaxID=1217721 RepID=A0A075K5V3_9GAMM|nr:restriction endonuclease [Dyella japonica]AIF49534.1 hypothetical protein HY57_20850 [Dyella japonica A8]
MAKRKESGIDIVASLPWPLGIASGFIAFIGIQYGIGWIWGSSNNLFLSGFAKATTTGIYSPFAWFFLIACCVAALLSFLKRRRRRQLLGAQTGMDSLRDMDWQAFELLVGEAFRRQGYAVEETGLGGADGGKDVVLRKGGRKSIVQCKQWRSQRVGVPVVREMYGVMVHEDADAVKIVALGGYTPEAIAFARNKPIELIDGHALLATVMDIQAKNAPDGALDNPLLFAGSAAACLLVAFALPTQPQHSSRVSNPAPPYVGDTRITEPATPTKPLSPPVAVPPAMKATVQPAPKVYKADPPMTDAELRDWERRNREAMKIMEKNTPELATPPPR